MAKVTLKGFILVPENELDAVKQALAIHIKLTKLEPGCLAFHVTEHPDNPCRFDVYEEFVDRIAFETHQQRVQCSDWGQITKNVERHYTISHQSS